jgi:flavorubredoxin
MVYTRNISDSIVWVGGSDRRLALFENLFPIPRGVSYNSYVILDEKTALLDTVDSSIALQFIQNVRATLGDKPLDYLIVNHMEPDHCATIEMLLPYYPNLKIVGNAKTFQMIRQFYDFDVDSHALVVKEGDALELGQHTLRFYTAPMVHWPEVMVSYEESEKVLFSADAFGTFGAVDGALFNDEVDFDKDWLEDAGLEKAGWVGHRHHLPPARAGVAQRFGLPAGQVRPVEPLRARGQGRGHLLRLHVRQHGERRQSAGQRPGGSRREEHCRV